MNKVLKAAEIYLNHIGYNIKSLDFDGYVIASGDGRLAFIEPFACQSLNEVHVGDRAKFEKALCKYVDQLDELTSMNVEYDQLFVRIVSQDRGTIKHYINAHEALI